MSDEQPFAAENPFRKLNKKSFQSAEDKNKNTFAAKALQNVKKKQADADANPFGDEEDAGTFLAAVSGATPLGSPVRSAVRRQEYTSPLENPLLGAVKMIRSTASGKTTGIESTPANSGTEEALPDYGEITPLSRKKNSRQKSREAIRKNREQPVSIADFGDPEDGSAFFSAVKDVQPLSGKGREVPLEIPAPALSFIEEYNPLQDFMDGKLEFALAFTDEYMEGHVIGLDLMTVGKLQAGQFSPEAHIDLHGMNAQQAFQALIGFFRGAYLKGLRTLLVVPGRGLNSPQGVSILRDKLQDWLTQEPFRRVVLAFCTAKPADGGAGALYVLMRKYRKDRGKVYWDRRPADPDLI